MEMPSPLWANIGMASRENSRTLASRLWASNRPKSRTMIMRPRRSARRALAPARSKKDMPLLAARAPLNSCRADRCRILATRVAPLQILADRFQRSRTQREGEAPAEPFALRAAQRELRPPYANKLPFGLPGGWPNFIAEIGRALLYTPVQIAAPRGLFFDNSIVS
jgi:hypothetical protein